MRLLIYLTLSIGLPDSVADTLPDYDGAKVHTLYVFVTLSPVQLVPFW